MGSDMATYEAQLEAMRKVMEALVGLPKEAQDSVLNWVGTQLGHSSGAINSQQQQRASAEAQSLPHNSGSGMRRHGTVSVVAQKLGANSCRTLLSAAAAHLTIYQGKESFSRNELIAAAKEARGWKGEYSNQMATAVVRMLESGELFEKSKDVFSLSDETMKRMETALARG